MTNQDLLQIAEEFGTPVYVYDADSIKSLVLRNSPLLLRRALSFSTLVNHSPISTS